MLDESPGRNLRDARERLALTLREVEQASHRIAEQNHFEGFAISLSRLSDIELKGVVPNVYRFYSLALIYGLEMRELLSWYGVPKGKGEQLSLEFEKTQVAQEGRRSLAAAEVIPITPRLNRSQRRAGVQSQFRCDRCLLVQFRTSDDLCRRCHTGNLLPCSGVAPCDTREELRSAD